MISYIAPTHGNPVALKRTLDSLVGICDEFIIGDVIIFPLDRELIRSYKSEFNIKIIKFEFNYIFKNGFSSILNALIEHATNNIVLYLNTGEIIEKGKDKILDKISDDYNCYYIDHSSEKHRWWRCFDKREVKWSGIIHEESIAGNGEIRPYPKPFFTFADTEKDMYDEFKAAVLNDSKELVYFNLYNKIIDDPKNLQGTDPGWVHFAESNYESMAYRLRSKGKRFEAFKSGNYELYMSEVYSDPEFAKQRFQSSDAIEFQGDKKYLL